MSSSKTTERRALLADPQGLISRMRFHSNGMRSWVAVTNPGQAHPCAVNEFLQQDVLHYGQSLIDDPRKFALA